MTMKKKLLLITIALSISTNICAKEIAIHSQLEDMNSEKTINTLQSKNISDDEIQSIILFGKPSELKNIIHNKTDTNKIYQCNSPLTLAIRGSLGIQELGQNAPIFAIEKMKYLIDLGADVNKETCSQNARYPLTTVLVIPLELHGYEELSNQAINLELNKNNGNCNIAGIISKPCKDITTIEISQLKTAMRQAFSDTKKMMIPYLMKMLSLLIESGANINKKDTIKERTALHHAVEIPSDITLEPTKFLIQNGADINSRDINGDTPLFIAAAVNNKEAVKILIDAGADTNIRNNANALYYEVIGFRQKPLLQEVINR